MRPPRKYGSQTKYCISGFSDMYAKNMEVCNENTPKLDDNPDVDLSGIL